MIEHKPHHSQRHYIKLNSRARRHSSLPFFMPKQPTCLLSLFGPQQLIRLLHYLTLVDLVKLHQALKSSKKTKDASKGVIAYLAKCQRIFSLSQQKEYMGFIVLRKRKLSKWRAGQRRRTATQWERIAMDVNRTNLWCCRSRQQIQAMRNYIKRVIFKLCCDVNRFNYVQGFTFIVRAMYESRLTQHEAYLLATYFLRDLQLARYYQNNLERMNQICYVLDVYIYNYLPKVHWHLKRNDLTAQCYAISWFLTLYSQDLPIEVLNRLWSLFLLKGWKVLVKFALALIFTFQGQILGKNDSQLPQFLRSLQKYLNPKIQTTLWQLYCSIKCTNKMITYLCRHMRDLEFDREISILQLKNLRDNGSCLYQQAQSFQFISFPSKFSVGVCCQKVQPSSFPYCNDF